MNGKIILTVTIVLVIAIAALFFMNAQKTSSPQNSTPFSTPSPVKDLSLTSAKWQWVKTQMSDDTVIAPPAEDNPFVIQFFDDNRLSSQTDCNSLSGGYETEGNVLTIGSLASTRMFCEGEILEDEYSNSLSNVVSYMFEGENLVLLLAFDSGSMIFQEAP